MKKAVLLVVSVAFLVLALSGVALAATPQEIYNDYAQDQKLDGTYTEAEFRAYLADAGIDQYGSPAVLTALDALVNGILGGETDGRDNFPFTGAELLVVAFGAVALIGGGAAVRRLGRGRA